ncbi:MAG: hypothetical protein Q4B60_08985 [Erysipelotrichaceae bacterium]|nr:hypothetical protein [Erysipelotrichaceae bacterium]
MCIIAVKPEMAKMFDEDIIRQMFMRNPDGAGYMYVENGNVRIRKGFMKVEDLLNDLDQHNFEGKNLVLHFRIGTSGLKDGLNTHPYPVYEENALDCVASIGMAHNGVLHDFTPKWGSKINDTQTFIHEVLQRLDKGFIEDEEKLFLIEKIIGTNRLAFLDQDDSITLLGDFIEEDGCYYSNSSYKPPVPVKYPSNYWSYYRPQSLFDDEERKVLTFDSEAELDRYIRNNRHMFEVDTDLYEDLEGNVYDVDRGALRIYKN